MDDLTKQTLLNLLSEKEVTDKFDLVQTGEKYFIRTVTFHYVGKVKEIKDGFIVLENASWIADSGRLTDALMNGFEKTESSEIELINGLIRINISSITDIIDYNHELPAKTK